MKTNIITLDVRLDFRSGQHPCDKIQNALGNVRDGQSLRLLVPFEPVPIYEVARAKGLAHQATPLEGGEWEVLFSPAPEAKVPSKPRVNVSDDGGGGCHGTESPEILDVDARGLEPPQPMVKILEALGTISDSTVVRARTERRPIHLYPVLEARGFSGETEEQADGSFITHIRRC